MHEVVGLKHQYKDSRAATNRRAIGVPAAVAGDTTTIRQARTLCNCQRLNLLRKTPIPVQQTAIKLSNGSN